MKSKNNNKKLIKNKQTIYDEIAQLLQFPIYNNRKKYNNKKNSLYET